MPLLTHQSPGVSTREIDLSSPTQISPSGVPAGVIGTAVRGPAFVPITVATFRDFVAKFGNTDGEKFGPLAMNEWLRNAGAGTYVRILGIGDGKKRTSGGLNPGSVNKAGFVVGEQQVQSNGLLGHNPYATAPFPGTAPQITFDVTAASLEDADRITIDVPVAQGGEGAADIMFAENAGGTMNGRIRIQIADRLAFTDADIAQLIAFAINGTAPTGAAPSGVGDFVAGDIQFPVGGTGQTGIQGLTATANGTLVVIQADAVVDGSLITFTDIGPGDAAASGFGASPSSPSVIDAFPGKNGRTYFLGSFMSASAGKTVLSEAGHQTNGASAIGIIRGMILAPSGVCLTLKTDALKNPATSNQPSLNPATPGGHGYGDIITGSGLQEFTMLINGHKASDESVQVITASFDPYAPNYFGKIFNRDPEKTELLGHYLHVKHDVYSVDLVHTGTGCTTLADTAAGVGKALATAFLLSSSQGHNSGTAPTATHIGVPNFENFEDRFQTARSPFVMSQKFGGKNKNLFRVHALDDGRAGSDAFKITISNIRASSNENDPYGSFDLEVRFFADIDEDPTVLEAFRGLDLNPSSDNYIARRIGDNHMFYDFDKSTGGQKLVIDGTYPNVSNYIRIEMADDVTNGSSNDTSLPVGFRGIQHLVTSGSTTVGGQSVLTGTHYNQLEDPAKNVKATAAHVVQMPVPFRSKLSKGALPKLTLENKLTWGIQFQKKVSEAKSNSSLESLMANESIRSYIQYYPDFHTSHQNPAVADNEGTPDKNGAILDADRYNNNMFTLERVQVMTGTDDRPDSTQWAVAAYKRDGVLASSIKDINNVSATNLRFIRPSTDFSHGPSRKYLKFTFPLQGGFDGTNIFDRAKSRFEDAALRREIDDAAKQGGSAGPTVSAYRKAISVMEEKTDVDIQLLAIPGVRHESVTDFAIESVERRFDAMYIMDIEERDTLNNPVTGSTEVINVRNTVNRHSSRNFDTSFAAAYFPDVVITDPSTLTNVTCPPSVAVLGAFGFNDAVAHPWFAPAGFNRGALQTALYPDVNLNNSNLDDLYSADINPITEFQTTPGVCIWGQKTLLASQSALDRVNVRRLMIDVRRQVKAVANSLLFEANRESTLERFKNAVTPILSRIQQQQGLDRFSVQIDTTTTTQADVENNTIRGKIFLQPTRSVEFISLDFAVTNAGLD